MAHHNTVFSQILKLIPRHEFESLARKHHQGQKLLKCAAGHSSSVLAWRSLPAVSACVNSSATSRLGLAVCCQENCRTWKKAVAMVVSEGKSAGSPVIHSWQCACNGRLFGLDCLEMRGLCFLYARRNAGLKKMSGRTISGHAHVKECECRKKVSLAEYIEVWDTLIKPECIA